MAWKTSRKGGLFGRITARFFLATAAVLLVLSCLSMFANPAKSWPSAVMGLLFEPLALLNFALLIWAILRRSRAVWIPVLALIPSLFLFGRYVRLGYGHEQAGEKDIKIVSYNVGRFMLARNGVRDPSQCSDSVMAFLRTADADIICLQEVYFKNTARVRSYFEENFPGYDVRYFVYPTDKGAYGNATLSRLKAVGKGKIEFDKSANMALYTDYKIDGRSFRIYNCHFQSYALSLTRLVELTHKKYRREFQEKFLHSVSMRPRQVDKVLEDIDKCPTETFVAGDFNDSPVSYTYSRLIKGRGDTFTEAGHGFGATYSAFWPFIRIDYIMVPKIHGVVSHKVIKNIRLSDHYPVIAEISMSK